MYQGKFDTKKKRADITVKEVVAARNEASRKNLKPMDHASQRKDPKKTTRPMQVEVRPAQNKGLRKSSVVFYTIFFLFVFVFYTGLYVGMLQLRSWLVDFEHAQPTTRSKQVFEKYFESPDWAEIYDMSVNEQQGSADKEAVVAYFEEITAGKTLTYTETSAGLSGNMKYIVRTGNEKLASFLLIDQNKAEELTDLHDWQLGEIELFIQSNVTYYVETLESCQVTVNGAILNQDQVIRRVITEAQEYLPDGVDDLSIVTYRIDGLLTDPSVTVTDKSGTTVDATFDKATLKYTALPAEEEIPSDVKELALNAVQAQCKYSITTAVTNADLAKYFVRGTETFKSMTSMDRQWLQTPRSYDFLNTEVKDYRRYADNLYSVYVSMTMTQTRGDGSQKESDIVASLLFEKQDSGKWLCSHMTALNIAEPHERIRLTFRQGEKILLDDFFASDSSQLTCPTVEVPDGKTFSGWATEQRDAGGNTVMNLVFQPDNTGLVTIPSGTVLKPMVLEPLFE